MLCTLECTGSYGEYRVKGVKYIREKRVFLHIRVYRVLCKANSTGCYVEYRKIVSCRVQSDDAGMTEG